LHPIITTKKRKSKDLFWNIIWTEEEEGDGIISGHLRVKLSPRGEQPQKRKNIDFPTGEISPVADCRGEVPAGFSKIKFVKIPKPKHTRGISLRIPM